MKGIERSAISKMAYLDETPLIVRLPRAQIYPDPDQPRKRRSQEKLEGLAQTMLVKQLQPILVRQEDGHDDYKIVIGEGRWLAAGINEEKLQVEQYLDCILVDESNAGRIRSMQLIENLQREDMNELDIANGYRELIELGECKSGKEVAERMGVSAATVSVFLKVLEAPEPIKQLVEKGITKIDTARTLMMLAEINPERADALVQAGLAGGVLKRSSVRDAYADEKTRAESAAAAAEAALEAAQQQDTPAASPEQPEQEAGESQSQPEESPIGTPAAPEAVAPQAQASAAPQGAAEPQQKAAAGVSHGVVELDKATPQKAPVVAVNASLPVSSNPANPAAAEQASTPPAPAAPAPLAAPPAAGDEPEVQAESPMVVTEKYDVLVSIRSGSDDEDRFIKYEVEYGNARLASLVVHRDPSRAWVQFGSAQDHETLQGFKCADLEIVKIVKRA